MNPSPPYLGLLLASCKKLETFLSRGCRLSPRASYDYDDTFEDEATQDLTKAATLQLLNASISASDDETVEPIT